MIGKRGSFAGRARTSFSRPAREAGALPRQSSGGIGSLDGGRSRITRYGSGGAEAATHHAEIRADLKRRGALIGGDGVLIAAHGRSLGLKLVTNNTPGFGRVRGLQVENWSVSSRRMT